MLKTFSVLALGTVIALCSAPQGDAAVQSGRGKETARRDQVCVYKDINYQGEQQCYSVGDEINNLGAQSKSISSIRVSGRATVTVYEKPAFGGRSAQFTSDVSDLGRRTMAGNTTWSDHIESLRIAGASGPVNSDVIERTNPEDTRRNPSQQPRDGICVYDRPNYEGRSECWNQGQNISDLARQGDWSGRISSIRLFGRSVAVVYRETGYRGESLTVNRNIPDLAAIRGKVTRNGNGNGNDNDNDDDHENGNRNRKGKGRGKVNDKHVGNWAHQISSLQVQSR